MHGLKKLVVVFVLLIVGIVAVADSLAVLPALGYTAAQRSYQYDDETASLTKHSAAITGTYIWTPEQLRLGVAFAFALRYPIGLSLSENGESVDADVTRYNGFASLGQETTVAAAYSLPFAGLDSYVSLGATMGILSLVPDPDFSLTLDAVFSFAIGPQIGWTVSYPLNDRLGIGGIARVGYLVYEPFRWLDLPDRATIRGSFVTTIAIGLSITGL